MNYMRMFMAAAVAVGLGMSADAQKLVLVHTNDTHSQIDPTDKNLGGVLRRKVLVDSIREAEPNVLLIDAGDAVQGTLYFNLYGGEVEHKMMNLLGYDIAILGNHDFDNGVDQLAKNLKEDKATWLATNYDMRGSALDGFFTPYLIKEYDGKRVGFFALNLEPKGMISEGNYDGVVYLDAHKAANATAWHLKHNENVDYVVVVSHIGYNPAQGPGDVEIATNSEDIDIIIGGHTHDTVDPSNPSGLPWKVKNAVGKDVVVTQTGKTGLKVGEITLDLATGDIDYRLIPVNSRLDNGIKDEWKAMLAPYAQGIDSLMNVKVGKFPKALAQDSPELLNFTTDLIKQVGEQIYGSKVDVAIGNKGGIRRAVPTEITEGIVRTTYPFNNYIVVEKITGKALLEALDVMAGRDGDGVSGINAQMRDGKIVSATVNGKPINPDATYTVATIDYLANGGDYMESLTTGEILAQSKNVMNEDFINWFKKSPKAKKIKFDPVPRMVPAK